MTEKSTTKSLPPGSKRPEDAWLPVPKLFAYGLQHVLTMYGGIIAVPLIFGKEAGVDGDQRVALVTASLFVGG
ncbi:MAG: purine permease, partial [Brevibacterium aurantiacum]|nr:purine permease [Brevibacterium aurantiacum]